MNYIIKPFPGTTARVAVPPDKSISHRALMLAGLCKGKTRIKPFLRSDDTRATLACMKKLGVKAQMSGDTLVVQGTGLYFSKNKPVNINARESGTTMRVVSGILSGQKFDIQVNAAPSLIGRPMSRIIAPLRKMGADIRGTPGKPNEEKLYPPLTIFPASAPLRGISYTSPVASAQVKSAILFAGLYAQGKTCVREPFVSRDHTERMLKLFGADIAVKGTKVILEPGRLLRSPRNVFVPGDFSSAAFFIVLGCIVKNTKLVIKDVNTNPTRMHLINVLKRMGARIALRNARLRGEPYADIVVESSVLRGTIVKEYEIPLMVDEVPILCVAAAFAKGSTIIKGVKELKVKETDRIESMVQNLRKAGVDISASRYCRKDKDDCQIQIRGGKEYRAATFSSFGDHRTAMSMIVFGMALSEPSVIDDVSCISKSFPEFVGVVKKLRVDGLRVSGLRKNFGLTGKQ